MPPASNTEVATDSIRTVLERYGYLDPSISHVGDTLVVLPGSRSVLRAIIAGSDSITLPNLPFTPDNLDTALTIALKPSRDRGHFFARAAINRITRDSNAITLHLSVTPGPVATVADQQFRGLRRTRPDLVRRFLPLTPGDTLTTRSLTRAERAARSIGFLRLERPPSVRPDPGFTGDAVIIWRFAERRQTRLEGLVGYVPDDSKALVWTADVRLLNPFGGGRDLRLTSQRRDRGRDILDFAWRQPVFWLGTGTFSASLATRDYREQFFEFRTSAGLTTDLAPGTTTGLDLTWRTIQDDLSQRSYSSYQIAASLSVAAVDQPLNPSEGYHLDWTAAYHHRRYQSDSVASAATVEVLNDTRLTARLAFYQPLVAGFIGHLALAWDGLETAEPLPPLSEMVLVGGPGSLRGYRTEQFAAIRAARVTVEPRWRFDQGALYVFCDGAYLSNRTQIDNRVITRESFEYGYGLGLLLSDSARRVSLSLGWHPGIAVDQPRLAVELSLDI